MLKLKNFLNDVVQGVLIIAVLAIGGIGIVLALCQLVKLA
jgi:hypothetical protein